MRQSALFSGFIYLLLGVVFTYFAIQNIQTNNGWGFLTYVLILLATFDIGSGIRIIAFHFINKKKDK
ncbi:YdiK family protein [Niallia sp. 03133]|uniref:YdiK family protein n=1 Tax=Niallia sp. 03133 TaxID=3458060 RepID=UPI004044D945